MRALVVKFLEACLNIVCCGIKYLKQEVVWDEGMGVKSVFVSWLRVGYNRKG